jgi:hypothetical protein
VETPTLIDGALSPKANVIGITSDHAAAPLSHIVGELARPSSIVASPPYRFGKPPQGMAVPVRGVFHD